MFGAADLQVSEDCRLFGTNFVQEGVDKACTGGGRSYDKDNDNDNDNNDEELIVEVVVVV
jgi:hypothetical protein